MSGLFVTSSGTEIGKTLVTCILAYQLKEQGRALRILKPVVSGLQGVASEETDPGRILTALGHPVTPQTIQKVSRLAFQAPLAPEMASVREGRSYSFEEIISASLDAQSGMSIPGQGQELRIIEGVGGVMAPLIERYTVLDWITELNYSALLVVGGYLGSLSHTLTAASVLQQRGIQLAGIVLSEGLSDPVPLEESKESLRRFIHPRVPIRCLPRLSCYTEAPPLTDLLSWL